MVEEWKKNKYITLLGIIGVVYFFLRYISPLVAPVLVAMLFVTISGPLLQKLNNRFRIHRQVGAVLLLVFFGGVIFTLLWMLFTWMAGSLPGWTRGMEGLGNKLEAMVSSLCDLGSRITSMNTEHLKGVILDNLQEGMNYLREQMLPELVSGSVRYAKELLAVGGFLLLFVVGTVFLAKDYDNIMNQMLNRQECHVFLEVICGVIRYIATFVKAQVVLMLITGCVCAFGLSVGGITGGAFWGILAGFLDALPFLGTGIVLVPLALAQLLEGAYGRALLCLVLYVICIVTRELLEPKLIGRKMGIPPLVVLVSLYAGIQLFGVAGIIKGPLGFVLVYETYRSLFRREETVPNKLT